MHTAQRELSLKDPVRQVEIEILRYLIAHGDARDTAEGIEKWWLPLSAGYGAADVSAALGRLQDRHLVRVWKLPSAKAVYGRDPADSGPLEEYLRELA